MVKVLLQNKAKSELCATDGQSPADLAYAQGFSAVSVLILFLTELYQSVSGVRVMYFWFR